LSNPQAQREPARVDPWPCLIRLLLETSPFRFEERKKEIHTERKNFWQKKGWIRDYERDKEEIRENSI